MSTLNLTRALVYLQTRSLGNALRVRIRRLKQPKYLIGAVVGLGYLYWWIGRALFGGWRHNRSSLHLDPDTLQTIEGVVAVVLFFVVAGQWIFTGPRAALQFSESELAFLLPAPLSRQMLIRYKLLRSQLGTLISAGFLTLFTGRFAADGHAFIHMLSWWLGLTVLNLHGMAASFTVQQLTERGLATWQRRVAGVAVLSVVLGAVAAWLLTLAPPPALASDAAGTARNLADWFHDALRSGPAPWLLQPFYWLVRPWFAGSTAEFLTALPPALLLLGLHYWWVERCDVSFEEASLEHARKRSEVLAAARGGKYPGFELKRKPAGTPFVLASTGFAPVALLWKNLVFARVTPKKLALAIGLVFALGTVVRITNLPNSFRATLWSLLLLAFGVIALLGGAYTSSGLRRDLGILDLMKGYPLPGWQIVLGELLGPATVILTFQWLTALAAVITFPGTGPFEDVSLAAIIVAALSAGLVVAPLNLVNALIPSAATLLFPAWARPGRDIQQPGFEAMGQRILFGVAQMAVMFVALLPAAALGFGGFMVANLVAGPLAGLALTAILAAAVLSVEAWFGVQLLGKIFERYDATAEE